MESRRGPFKYRTRVEVDSYTKLQRTLDMLDFNIEIEWPVDKADLNI